MRYSVEHKEQTRARIMAAAARVFREGGFGGAGIDGLTKAAGVTNGAFYGHFKTKSEAFRAALTLGFSDLRDAIVQFRASHGADWLPAFVRFYLGPRQEAPLAEACVLPTLSSEAMRADLDTREVFTAGLQTVVDEITDGITGKNADERQDAAIVLLAQIAGGALLARSVGDPAMAKRITQAVIRKAGVCR